MAIQQNAYRNEAWDVVGAVPYESMGKFRAHNLFDGLFKWG